MQFLSVFPFLSFKWRGQAFDLYRSSVWSCTAELELTSWLVAFLPPMHRISARTGCPSLSRIPQTSKLLYAAHALKGSSVFYFTKRGVLDSLWDWLSPGVPVFELLL